MTGSDSETDGDNQFTDVKEEAALLKSGSVEVKPTVITMAAVVKLEPPTFISDKKSYEAYKRELKVWSIATSLEKSKQALVVALSLPEEHDSNIKEKVFSELDTDDLNTDDGLKILIETSINNEFKIW